MSETIDYKGDIYPEQVFEIAQHYPPENLSRMLEAWPPPAEIFLDDCDDGDYFLLVRTSKTRYSYLSDAPGDEVQHDNLRDDREWAGYMLRSYRIIHNNGELPYAYRS